jgi:CRP/FNR family transcriptional regulator, global nitrogen regulator
VGANGRSVLSAPVMLPASARAGRREERECRKLLDMLCVTDATTFERQYTRGEVIIREYEQGNGLYFLTDGVAKLSKAYSVGKEATLMLLGPWDVFGDLAFDQTTYPDAYQHARVEALTTCWVRKVPKVFVERTVKARPEVALKLAAHLMRAQQTQYGEMVGYLLPYKVETKLANLLLMLARRFGGEEELGRLTIRLRLTHEELAAMVLSTRESVSHALSILRRRGTLTTEGGCIVILAPTSLLEAANAGTGF